MTDLLLESESVADMDLERAALVVGRAYDAEPELRPMRVGDTECERWGTG